MPGVGVIILQQGHERGGEALLVETLADLADLGGHALIDLRLLLRGDDEGVDGGEEWGIGLGDGKGG